MVAIGRVPAGSLNSQSSRSVVIRHQIVVWRLESVESLEVKMGVTKEEVQASLTSKLNPSHLEVTDTSGGCGASFEIEIVSEQFEGKRLLERHRMVNTALTEEMKHIHALSIKKALTSAQWKQQQESNNTKSA
ncbi:hypothetical protein NE237_016637 [Protea cynaroides]|uniref:Uncharacterized protein n=1 Tax=Protea cynaroides TaxID=273540 RepID=A0A9Q0K730_9MAGN|nr:hypothetical protein NE237_016637 [Protea cynaroides]